VAAEIVELILAARRQHPRWGRRTLLVVLKRQQPTRAWPVASTLGNTLRTHGLVHRRRRRRCRAPYGERLADYAAPNAIWCADFKGHFPVGAARCHPLTIMDGLQPLFIALSGVTAVALLAQDKPRKGARSVNAPTVSVFVSSRREHQAMPGPGLNRRARKEQREELVASPALEEILIKRTSWLT